MAQERAPEARLQEASSLTHRGGLAWFAVSLITLLLLYILGVGPVLTFTDDESVFRTFYRPLFLCEFKCPPLAICIDWYVSTFWQR